MKVVLILLLIILCVVTAEKILLVSVPFYGHFNPIRYIATEMQKRGHEVHVASTLPFISKFKDEFPTLNASYLDDGFHVVRKKMEELPILEGIRVVLGNISDMFIGMHEPLEQWILANKPDLIVADYFTVPAIDLALKHGIKVVANKPALLSPVDDLTVPAALSGFKQEMTVFERVINTLIKASRRFFHATDWLLLYRYRTWRDKTIPGLPAITDYFDDSICAFPRLVNFVFGADYAQHISPLVTMVGHIGEPNPKPLTEDLEQWLEQSKPVIVANFGTSAYISREKFVKIVQGLTLARQKHSFSVLWRVPDTDLDTIPDQLPSFIRIVNWLPSQVAVFQSPHVKLFITHAGVNSPYEAISNGIPLLAIPIIADQVDHSVRLAHHNLSISLARNDFTNSSIASAIDTLFTSPIYARAAKKVAKILNRRGLKHAVDTIEEILDVGYDHLVPNSYKLSFIQKSGLDMYLLFILGMLFPICGIISCLIRQKSQDRAKLKIQ